MNIEFNDVIFGKNDIRGKMDEEITPELFTCIGKAYAAFIEEKQPNSSKWITVGYDARNHSPELTEALVEGLRASGLNVYNLGLCPTPLCYFSEYTIPEVNGTLIVTASHNPPEYNGIKMTFNKAILSEEEISEIRDLTRNGNFVNAATKGEYKKHDIISDYLKTQNEAFKGAGKGLKIVVDSGNATGGVVAPQLYRDMGCEVIDIFSEPDGDFPNHHPNPTSEANIKDLKAKVIEIKADLGIAFDGDSDRIGIVDNEGYALPGDQLMLIFALDILNKTKEKTPVFVSEVKCSQVLYDTIEANGGQAIMWKTGHGFIKSKMKQENALLAGEMSGHIFFKDRYFGFDDAVYAGCRFIEIIAEKKVREDNFNVSSFIKSFPNTITSPEIRISCPNEHKYRIVKELQEEFTSKPDVFINKIEKVITIDGVRLVFNDGFALIRASNTEPVFTLRFEAGTQENLDNYKSKLLEIVDEKIKNF